MKLSKKPWFAVMSIPLGVLLFHQVTITERAIWFAQKQVSIPAGERIPASDQLSSELETEVKTLRTALETFDDRDAFLKCLKQENPESCFHQKLLAAFLEKSAPRKLDAEMKHGEENRFFSTHLFSQEHEKVHAFYESLFTEAFPAIRAGALEIWNQCKTVPGGKSLEQATLIPYDPGAYHADASALNCINHRIPHLFTDIRTQVMAAKGLNSFTAEGVEWANHRVLFPRIKSVMDQKLEEEAAIEQGEFDSVRSVLSSTKIGSLPKADCEKAVREKVDEQFAHVEFPFLDRDQERRGLVSGLCHGVDARSAAQK